MIKKLWNYFGDVVGQTIFHPQYFVKKADSRHIRELKKQRWGRLLDVGCGRQWYRKQLESCATFYYALDHPLISKKYDTTYPIEIFADASSLPLQSQTIDVVSLLMVLEHIKDPERAIQEIKRVLTPDGFLFITTVENYPGHDLPHNYIHWTVFGLQTLLRRHGFQIVRKWSFGNFWETQNVYRNVFLMQMVKNVAHRNVVLGVLLLIIFSPIMILGNIVALLLGWGRGAEEYALAHTMIARKRLT